LATLALAHVTAALLAQENQNPGSPGLAAYIELQGAAMGEVSSINAGITASTTRQYGDSFRKSEKLKAKADGRLEPKKASDPHGPATSEVSFAEPKESILVN
jgi:hypothetical protein